MKRPTFLAALVVAALSMSITAAFAASSTSNWHIGYYNSSDKAFSFAQASSGGGLASLNFTNAQNTALLVTKQKVKGSGLLGDMTTKTVSANFTISGVTGTFSYYGQPDGCGTPASVRYYFETSNAKGFDETHYWWSNPVSAQLDNGTVTLDPVSLVGSNWSDFYGHYGNDSLYSDGFAAAVKNVTTIGLSFGGGCFFENGVGTTDGSGTFVLNSYTAN